ncbi:MAG: putative metalloprotease YpwA [Candidatus Heimdallarchaeota archaeon LC_3]|nr:MAG: putative metalloprotease YpwA [Candidatus Heimdallarchaeota archaeon LC_3]
MNHYNQLLEISNQLGVIQGISSQLQWDSITYIPKNGIQGRADQLAFMSKLFNKKLTSSTVGTLLNSLMKKLDDFDGFQRRNISVFNKEFERMTKVPLELLSELRKLTSKGQNTWAKAREKKDFKMLKPELDEIIKLKKKIASYINPSVSPLDVFIDQFEPGMNSSLITSIFNNFRPKLIRLLEKCNKSDLNNKKTKFNITMPRNVQEAFLKDIVAYLGYNFDSGRLDQTEHPFTIGGKGDVRITTNYNEKNFVSSLFGAMHEAGHGIHNQNIPQENYFMPVNLFGGSAGFAESQSRFFENIIGKSPEFWDYYFPRFLELTKKEINEDDFVIHINQVRPSKIRIFADELTYQLHIMLRYEIEEEIFNKDLPTHEFPQIWNEKVEKFLGLEIENDAEGVLQDVHWAGNYFGYFPTYTLGNLYNAQIYNTLRKKIEFEESLLNGNIGVVKQWLVDNVHLKTGYYDPSTFLEKITNEPLNSDYFINYLTKRYEKLFQI